MVVTNMGKENDKYFAVIYLPCSVIKSQQVLLSSHSHSYWKRETRDVVYAQASGLIFLCFNHKMPIAPCARHISTCLTMCILNQAHLFNPNWRQSKFITKANPLCQSLISLQKPKSDELHALPLSGTQTGGLLLLSLQPAAEPHEVLGPENTEFLPPHHEHWGRFVMDHWEGFKIILFIPVCAMMKHSAAVDVWWVSVGDKLPLWASCPVSCNCR